jgi:hypothetical protein
MQDSQRLRRFIEAFERLYGRAPKREDAKGDFKQVAKDMQISVGAARYYLRLAAEPGKRIALYPPQLPATSADTRQ